MSKELPKIIAGVHNDTYNLDYYDDGSINVYNHKDDIEITTFDPDAVATLYKHIIKHKPKLF